MQRSRYFRIDWVLVDQLAIGPAPRAERHLDRLRDAGIRCVLSLCAPDEATPPPGLGEGFRAIRYVLPDHRAGRLPTLDELETALWHLAELQQHGAGAVRAQAATAAISSCLGFLCARRAVAEPGVLEPGRGGARGVQPLLRQARL